MRIAFGIMGGDRWTGGANYIENLISVLAEFRTLGAEPLLVAGTTADPGLLGRLSRYLDQPAAISPVWDRCAWNTLRRSSSAHLLQRDVLAEREFRKIGADLVFQHSVWLGSRFSIPTLAWIADFQHRRRPEMFSPLQRLRRDVGYHALSLSASRIMVSSLDAKADCEQFYPRSRGKIEVVRFAVSGRDLAEPNSDALLERVRQKYALPDRYLFLPNQLWKHKNHIVVIQALKVLRDQGEHVQVIACGNPEDYRHPKHPDYILAEIKRLGVGDLFTYLGMVPREYVLPLMRLSCAMINPSLHEGWSTTVEEAKALGVPMVLSDIAIHREQAGSHQAWFFAPESSSSASKAIVCAFRAGAAESRAAAERNAHESNAVNRRTFADSFVSAARAAISAEQKCRKL